MHMHVCASERRLVRPDVDRRERLQVGGSLLIAGGLVGLGGEVAWPTATRPGDVLRVENEVVAVVQSRSRPDRGTVTVRSETRNQRGEVAQTATIKLLVPRGSNLAGQVSSR
jgi:acyl dehydratase